MENLKEKIALQLLQIKAIKLQPANPFTWASGWVAPIYCDNRQTLSYPNIRNFIKIEFARRILERWSSVDVIAGVATGAIAQGAMVADLLGKPFVYVRSSPKGHGLENLIEGDLKPGQKVVVIEDLISTGGSSLKAVEALRNNGAEVLGMFAIFSYGFKIAEENFSQANVECETLSDYQTLIRIAAEGGYVSSDDLNALAKWRDDPANWKK
ncbi:orotate phosphoribosyltransferase [Thermophagus sp. OGC60D27]|uniref:orotate phosphoribosyltransferase n=1 Tax=Thermophagus sp. OGC60D27 TaxID=3458415 RepID=UPI004037F016